jgi:hypothetical protein
MGFGHLVEVDWTRCCPRSAGGAGRAHHIVENRYATSVSYLSATRDGGVIDSADGLVAADCTY